MPYEERIKEWEWLTPSFIRISLKRGILSFLFLYLLGFGRETGSQRFGERSIHSIIVNSLFCVSKYFPMSWGGVGWVFGKPRLILSTAVKIDYFQIQNLEMILT